MLHGPIHVARTLMYPMKYIMILLLGLGCEQGVFSPGVLVELRYVESVMIGVRGRVSVECRKAEGLGGVGIGRGCCGTDD